MGDTGALHIEKWWRKPFSMLQTNLREIDASMDVDKVASYIAELGVDAWLIGVGGIQAQYPTDLDFHSKNSLVAQRKNGDLISDAFAAASARGLRLLARMDFSKVTAEVAAKHPEWCFVSPEGKQQWHTGDLVSVCPSGGYYQERIYDILDEVVCRYPFDGFFINWTTMNEEDYYKRYHGVCHCGSCQARWHRYTGGLELPNGPLDANYGRWLSFSREVLDEITNRVRAFIAERLPTACLILGKSADIMFHEANNAIGRELWHHATSETVSTWFSYRPDVPVLVNSTCFLDMPYRMASEEPSHFAQYLLQCISRGGYPSTYMMGTPGQIPYLCLETAGEISRYHKKWRAVYDGLRPSSKTALVRPDRAHMKETQYREALCEYRGLFSALQEVHIPFDVIAQEHIVAMAENERIGAYVVVILPNLGTIQNDTAVALDSWVLHGGRLITTGSSGVADHGVVQLRSLPFSRRIALDNKREQLWSSYFAPHQTIGDDHVYSGPLVPLYGSHHLFEWKTETGGGYKLLAHAPFSPPEKAYGNIQVEQRGYGTGTFGRGKGVVIPFTVGSGYRELGLSVFRDFFTKILEDEGCAQEKFSCDIAEQVALTVNTTGSKTVIHLINMSGAKKQNFGAQISISGGTIRVAGANIRAHALHIDQKLEVINGIIALPTLELFEVIVIEGL
ncbi:glycosyl hydrolase 6-domain-containing protein [Aspergillus karnatakaensis]|uniref:alpha-amylase family protein n=1 Tax=Aspergillus karnatakaensis TaxID=1810916 RepID=UPI003CCD64A0